MKKKMAFSIAVLVFISLAAVACAETSPGGPESPQSPQPTPIETQKEAPTEPDETAMDDVKAQMAGFWRLDYPNIYNATIMILFEDGRWKSPGHLPTDHTSGGSVAIAGEESGIYQLRLTVEQSTSPYSEIGYEIGDYFYDARNDLLFTVFGSGEGNSNVGFIREHDATFFNESLFEAGFALLEQESYGFLYYSMPYEDVIEHLGQPDREHEPDYWSADGLYHWSAFYDSDGYMQISFVNETGKNEGARVFSVLTSTYFPQKTTRGIELGSTRDDVLEAYADVINAEDSRGNRIVAGSVYGGVFFFMDYNDKVEMIFIGASTEWAMLQY
jgi:hypothetical protein